MWRQEREQEVPDKRQQAEWESGEQQKRAEWDASASWVKQNPATAERLRLVEKEQIEDPEHRAWISERRQTIGLEMLTDSPRLFNRLKAQRDLTRL